MREAISWAALVKRHLEGSLEPVISVFSTQQRKAYLKKACENPSNWKYLL